MEAINISDKSGVNLPRSYHTFIYPFSYEYHTQKKTKGSVSFAEYLTSVGWEPESFFKNKPHQKEQYEGQFEEQYNTYQYLFPIARPNVMNCNDDTEISCRYIYKLNQSADNEFLIITRDEGRENPVLEEKRTIQLRIKNLKLSTYSKMKIGVLTIETEYYSTDTVWFQGKEITDIQDIACIINSFGRRLFSPVYDLKNTFTPERTVLHLYRGEKEKDEIITDFTSTDYRDHATAPAMISRLMNGSEKTEKTGFDMKSILDDRMFAACLIRKQMSDNLFTEPENTELYRYAFCDGVYASCQNDEMLELKLKEHTYLRWQKYGTIYTVTEYAMNCITNMNTDRKKDVITPFLTEYVELVKVALAQRAAIVQLEAKAGEISKNFQFGNEHDKGKRKPEKTIIEIRNLWKEYVLFQNKLYMPEVTFQEQGVELYGMLKKFLKLEEQNTYLDEELNNLHDVAELENDNSMNKSINLLTVAGTALAIVSMAQDFLSDFSWESTEDIMSILIPGAAGIYFAGFIVLATGILHSAKHFDDIARRTKGSWMRYFLFCVAVLLLTFIMFYVKRLL